MRRKIELILEKMHESLSDKCFQVEFRNILSDEEAIFIYISDGVDAYLGLENTKRNFDEIWRNAINAMQDINMYAEKYGVEKVFVFDENDHQSVLSCANDFLMSVYEYSTEH